MAKKYIPIIAGVVAIIAIIVIAIIGSNPDLRNRNVYVSAITVTTQANGTIKDNNEDIKYYYMTDDNTTITDGKYTFKLEYTVSPANATEKTVNFTSSDTTVATVDENGLVTFERNESVYITLTAKDERAVSTRVQLVWPADVDSGISVSLDNNNELVYNKIGNTQFYSVEEGTLYLYKGMNYAISTNAVITVSDSTVIDFEEGSLNTLTTGTFTITFTFGEGESAQTKTQNVEVVEYINNFQMGASYSAYLNTISNLNNDSLALNFLNAEAMPYEVGASNAFHFDLTVQNQDLASVSLLDANLVYTVYEVIDGENSLVEDNSSVFTVNQDGTLQFKTTSIGKSYQVSVLPKYNFLNRQAVTFNFKVVDGVNVYTHDELKTNFADLDVNNIILHSTIVAEVEENQLDPNGRLINFDSLTSNNGVTGDIYTRLYTEEEINNHADNLDITLSGNYFRIDASNIPFITVLGAGSGYSNYDPLSWTQDSGYPCASIQTAIFKVQDVTGDAYNTGIEKTNIVNFNISNLSLEGNTSTGILYDNFPTDPETGLPVVPDDEAQVIADQGSSSAGFMGRGAVKINTNNVIVLKTNIGIYVTGSCGGITTNYTMLNDSWANGIFGWRTTTVTIENTTVQSSGGAAINFTDATVTDAYSEDWMDVTLTIGENVVIDNYVSGTEGYFIVNNLSAVVPKLKGQLNPQIQNLGKTVLKNEVIDGQDYSLFNFVIQFGKEKNNYSINDYVINNIGSEDGWRVYVPGMWLERQGEYLVNVNNPNESYLVGNNTTYTITNKTVDSQITINMFTGYDNDEPVYTTLERKSGYYNNAVTTAFNGVGLGGVSKISNVDDALLLAGVVGGYITDESFANYILGISTPPQQGTTVATLLHGEDTLIKTAEGLGLNLGITSTLDKIKAKISALGGGNLQTGLSNFAGLSANDPEGLEGVSQLVYLCDYDILSNIKANIAKFNELVNDPMFSSYQTQIQSIIAGYELVQTGASSNSTVVQATVAITCNNDLIDIQDSDGTTNLIEVKINSDLLGEFSGILIFAGLLPYSA